MKDYHRAWGEETRGWHHSWPPVIDAAAVGRHGGQPEPLSMRRLWVKEDPCPLSAFALEAHLTLDGARPRPGSTTCAHLIVSGDEETTNCQSEMRSRYCAVMWCGEYGSHSSVTLAIARSTPETAVMSGLFEVRSASRGGTPHQVVRKGTSFWSMWAGDPWDLPQVKRPGFWVTARKHAIRSRSLAGGENGHGQPDCAYQPCPVEKSQGSRRAADRQELIVDGDLR